MENAPIETSENQQSVPEKPQTYYQKNREKMLAQQAIYNKKHKKERNAYSAAHYQRNREKRLAQTAAYQKAHPEARKAARQRWLAKNPEYARALAAMHARQWRKDHPEQYRANVAISVAIRCKKLIRPTSCSACGKTCKPQAHHHRGYAQEFWLDVIWLCRPCHILADG